MSKSTSKSALSAERERLRNESREGACPVCGRSENDALERQIREYAAANARLHAQLNRKAS